MNPFSAFPPMARAIIYWLVVLAGVVVGALQQSYDTAGLGYPIWLMVAEEVVPWLLVSLGLTAASNIYMGGKQTPSKEEVAARLVARRDDQDPVID
jgi:hypothetical protein